MKPALLCLLAAGFAAAQSPTREMRDLNGYFPMAPVASAKAWETRRAEIERRVAVANGLWPMPEKTPLNAVIHGRVEGDDYTVDRVFFESLPGHFVTGSLYLPKKKPARMPAILCPHGHWTDGRFMDRGVGTEATKKELDSGAEELECAARSPLQARCVQLARMGCAAFLYDMLGYADSLQFTEHRHGAAETGFLSPGADLRLQTYLGLQTWNGIRAVDFLLSLEGVDPQRIGCTGASGGGTQTMMIAGLDSRVRAAFPCVMVSTSMQGGCTCENSHHLRIGQGNIDIAALTAPRPLGLTAADDWTRELATKGLPELTDLYAKLGVPDHLSAHIATQFPHNYNLPSRRAMYAFFNKHFHLGLSQPEVEREFRVLGREELSVWTGDHAAPTGDQVGEAHEKAVCAWMTEQDVKHIQPLVRGSDKAALRATVGAAWEVLIGRQPPAPADVEHELLNKEDRGDYLLMEGISRLREPSEEVRLTFLYPKNWNGEAVLWLSLEGAASIHGASGPTPAARALLDAGKAVACPELYLQGATEQPKAGGNINAKPNDFREFSGYTFGYNPSLFARRVHDVMTVVAMMKGRTEYPLKRLQLRGSDGAGAIALAAAAVLGTTDVEADTEGFRFANLPSPWHIHFLPGAVKYGDIEALRRLCEP
jgi:hypothetical protein